MPGFYQFTIGLALLLAAVWVWYYIRPTPKPKESIADHPWFNRTWRPKPGFNDEFAGPIAGTCGQIRPGEWQCNCIDKDAGCRTLIRLKSEAQSAEDKGEITDRRGAIRAQKARNRNGN